jgi:hypothetical protein
MVKTRIDPPEKAGKKVKALLPDRLTDNLARERKQLVAPPVAPVKLIAERAGTARQVFRQIQGLPCDAYFHWGLNE